jgi:hypothetical protein
MLPSTRPKRYNNFNIFFMLERQLILSTLGGGDENDMLTPLDVAVKYKKEKVIEYLSSL